MTRRESLAFCFLLIFVISLYFVGFEDEKNARPAYWLIKSDLKSDLEPLTGKSDQTIPEKIKPPKSEKSKGKKTRKGDVLIEVAPRNKQNNSSTVTSTVSTFRINHGHGFSPEKIFFDQSAFFQKIFGEFGLKLRRETCISRKFIGLLL